MVKSPPSAHGLAFLPVLYIHLDPSLIPTLDELDNLMATSTKLPATDCAVKALRALQILMDHPTFPYDACLDLWHRCWPWMHFVHTFWKYLPGFVTGEQSLHRVPALPGAALILKMLADHPTRDMIYGTPGVRRIIAETWASLLYTAPIPPDYLSLEDLTTYLLAMAPFLAEPLNFEEITADAFGGSRHDFATAIIRHIKLAADGKTRPAPTLILKALPDFTSALLSCGLISSLVSALAVDGRLPSEPGLPRQVVDITLGLLIEFMKMAPGYTGMVEALGAGLLPYLARFLPKITPHGSHARPCQVLAPPLPTQWFEFKTLALTTRDQTFLRTLMHAATRHLAAFTLQGSSNNKNSYHYLITDTIPMEVIAHFYELLELEISCCVSVAKDVLCRLHNRGLRVYRDNDNF
ncbi:hypothetical protein B0H16DRAFT_1474544 [Mycena metata]|uniref:Uncharacterized protein n=1 Tax=Mycena metata TaxID=1033252 RepID=A0AAD7HGE6_9AGAR|nr:hypothetical protein B0H16DRAFT_1474544 [Mycena metata]